MVCCCLVLFCAELCLRVWGLLCVFVFDVLCGVVWFVFVCLCLCVLVLVQSTCWVMRVNVFMLLFNVCAVFVNSRVISDGLC